MLMGKFLNIIKWGATLGKEPQTFLGARWIQAFLKRVPETKKRIWALRMVAMSPHYFIDAENPAYQGMRNEEYLETNFRVLTDSRQEIYEKILGNKLEKSFAVMDYGCGPGFLAKATAPHVKKIYAVDISSGAVACAKIINPAKNIEYLEATETGLKTIPDDSLEAIYSFAVVQHLTDEVFELVLENCYKKLKKNGLLILHIQLIDEIWKTEEQWKTDQSAVGKVKYKYGLHCFGRTEKEHLDIVLNHRFTKINIEKIEDFVNEKSDEIYSQRLLTAYK